MSLTNEALAEAFSRHRFAEAYPHLAEGVAWTIVGGDRIAGRDQVVAACEESAVHLAEVRTTFRRFRTIVAEGCVVVDSEAEYTDSNGTTAVASCDIYGFVGGQLSEITSYTIEVT